MSKKLTIEELQALMSTAVEDDVQHDQDGDGKADYVAAEKDGNTGGYADRADKHKTLEQLQK